MDNKQHLVQEIERRKKKIVSFFSTLFIISGIISFYHYTVNLIIIPKATPTSLHWLAWGLSLAVIGIALFTRYFYVQRNIKQSFLLIVIVFTASAIFVLFSVGTVTSIAYLLIATMILGTSIIFDVKKATYFFFFITIVIFIIYFLHSQGLVSYNPTDTTSTPLDTIMNLLFVGIITYIARVSYEQIEHAYQRAFNYAKALEKLNLALDRKVKLRTVQLEESFKKQADSLHVAAIMGNIAKPMLHDLATPLSSLKGAIHFSNCSHIKDDNFARVAKAVDQIERIIENGRNLMNKRDDTTPFSPFKVTATVIDILKSELSRNHIKTINKINPSLTIKGSPNLFERVLVNIVLNAIEELKERNEKRVIKLTSRVSKENITISVRDSGRGIKEEFLAQIFDPDFSLKKSKGNLGLGLPFVKSIMENNFKGGIMADSKYGEYTEFNLEFPQKPPKKTNSKK